MAAADDNPLLAADFDFPPFDRVDPSHVRPGIRDLLTRLVSHPSRSRIRVDPKVACSLARSLLIVT
jgi:oligopeptidase A